MLLIVWVHSFSKMLPYVKFTEDKVLVFVILRKTTRKQYNSGWLVFSPLMSDDEWREGRRQVAMQRLIATFSSLLFAGRTELPESVKALFRPVVCIVPDLQQICEIMLFSEGFLMAKVLAKKMTVLYKLSKEQLSKQYHYDFGLRALKSVLVMAGELKRSSPELTEDVVLMRALRDMNLPKFVFEDVPLFSGLVGDLFPGLACPRVRYPDFNDAVEEVLPSSIIPSVYLCK